VTTGEEAYCWGLNSHGELGDGTTTNRLTPTVVVGNRPYRSISAGYQFTCGVLSTNPGYCWGMNAHGQLGDGTTTQRLVPTLVSGTRTFLYIATGYEHTCGAAPGVGVSCWGSNEFGSLGDGTNTDQLTPKAVPNTGGVFNAVTAGVYNSCAINANGQASCWGGNNYGQVGDGTIQSRLNPTAVSGGRVYTAIREGNGHTCGVAGGQVFCWGFNRTGQIGDGTTSDRLTPVLVQFTSAIEVAHR
jgi:alpha-tubulin suppressor-like RCC1 family protein